MSLFTAQHVIDGPEVTLLSGKTFQTADAIWSAADAFTGRCWPG